MINQIINYIHLISYIIGSILFIIAVYKLAVQPTPFGLSMFDSIRKESIKVCHLCKTEFKKKDEYCVNCGNIRRNLNV